MYCLLCKHLLSDARLNLEVYADHFRLHYNQVKIFDPDVNADQLFASFFPKSKDALEASDKDGCFGERGLNFGGEWSYPHHHSPKRDRSFNQSIGLFCLDQPATGSSDSPKMIASNNIILARKSRKRTIRVVKSNAVHMEKSVQKSMNYRFMINTGRKIFEKSVKTHALNPTRIFRDQRLISQKQISPSDTPNLSIASDQYSSIDRRSNFVEGTITKKYATSSRQARVLESPWLDAPPVLSPQAPITSIDTPALLIDMNILPITCSGQYFSVDYSSSAAKCTTASLTGKASGSLISDYPPILSPQSPITSIDASKFSDHYLAIGCSNEIDSAFNEMSATCVIPAASIDVPPMLSPQRPITSTDRSINKSNFAGHSTLIAHGHSANDTLEKTSATASTPSKFIGISSSNAPSIFIPKLPITSTDTTALPMASGQSISIGQLVGYETNNGLLLKVVPFQRLHIPKGNHSA